MIHNNGIEEKGHKSGSTILYSYLMMVTHEAFEMVTY